MNCLWIWTGTVHLVNDYANRNWAGLTESFYTPRWKMFIHDVVEAVENGAPFDEKAFFDR